MAYSDIPDTDLDIDSPGKEDAVFKKLRDNIRAVRMTLFPYVFTEQSTASGTFVTLVSRGVFYISLTAYTGLVRKIELTIEVKVSAGTGTFRLRDSGGTAGSEETSTSTTYEDKKLTLNTDAGWLNSTRTIEVQAHGGGANTVYVRNDARLTGVQFY